MAQAEPSSPTSHSSSAPKPASPPRAQSVPSGRPDRREDRRPRPQGAPRSPKDRNTVFIGNKPPMNYVLAVVTQFNQHEAEVVIRARGKAISQAVDVAEIVRNKFYSKCSVKHVGIGTEQITGDDGRKRMVSAIEIRLQNDEMGGKPATGAAGNLPQAQSPQAPPVEPATPAKSGGV